MLIFLYVSIVLHLVIALYVIYKNFRNPIHIYFSLFAIFIALWAYSNLAFLTADNESDMQLWAAWAYNIGSTMLLLMYLFTLNVSGAANIKRKTWLALFVFFFSIIIVYIPDFVYSGVNFDEKSIDTLPGVFLVFASYFYFILCTIKTLYSELIELQNKERNQLRIILIALSLSIFFGVLFNVILPSVKIYYYVNVGPSFTLIFISLITYSILQYQLFDIRLVLGKVFYYVLVAIPPYFTYFALAYIYESLFDTSFNTVAYIVGIPVAITFTAFLNFFTKFISEYTDTHLINPGYNPLVVLEQHRQRLSNTLDIEKIIQESLFIIARTIRPSSSGAILISRNKGERWMSINYKKAPYESPEEFKIFTEYFFNHPEKAINYHNLLNTATGEDVTFIQNKHLASQMEKKDIGVIIVLKEEATIRGLLLVGRKEADEPYSNQEIKFLVSIGDSMGLALGRALLYQETQQFNEELQQRVHDATSTLQKQNSDLETALAQLEEVRRQEKDMLDVMGHELRTPVSIARNALLSMRRHLQENEIPNPEKLKRYTKMAVEGTRREIALVETLLSTTKLEGNRMEVNLVPMSLMRVIKYGLRSHMDLAEKNRTEIVYNKPEKDIIVSADKVRIQEIMDNFLNNAIKYTGQGKVEITVYEKDGLGWIDVKDTGIGISEENLAHLGKKFFRAQNLYNKSKNVVNPSGTGLGLFVSFLLIDIMKGQKKITSKEGEGSTFSFGLPIYNGPLELEEESAEEMEESETIGQTQGNPNQSDNKPSDEQTSTNTMGNQGNKATEGTNDGHMGNQQNDLQISVEPEGPETNPETPDPQA